MLVITYTGPEGRKEYNFACEQDNTNYTVNGNGLVHAGLNDEQIQRLLGHLQVCEDFLNEGGARGADWFHRFRQYYNVELHRIRQENEIIAQENLPVRVEGQALPMNQVETEAVVRPPLVAERIIYVLLPKRQRVAVIGDLRETYVEAYRLYDPKTANAAYWKDALCSLAPLLWHCIKCAMQLYHWMAK